MTTNLNHIREAQVMKDRGWTNVAIAKKLGISVSTVRRYLTKDLIDEFLKTYRI